MVSGDVLSEIQPGCQLPNVWTPATATSTARALGRRTGKEAGSVSDAAADRLVERDGEEHGICAVRSG